MDAAQQLNQIQQFNNGNALINSTSLQYDANGSLTSKQSPQGTLTLTWDAQNRLASATSNITQTGTGSQASTQAYTYDAFDRRISKTISAGAGASTTPVTHYLYDGDNIHAEYANWAQPINITSYTGTDNAIGRFSLPTNATAATAFSSANYLHTNAQGNTDVITQHTTTGLDIITGTAVRDPFGKLSTVNATVSPAINNQSPALQGRSRDETGLHNFRARYLDVDAVQTISTNRFISRDPLGYEGGINPYVAFENDPLTYSDPSGTTVRLAANTVSSYYSGAVNAVSNSYQSLSNTLSNSPGATLGRNFGAFAAIIDGSINGNQTLVNVAIEGLSDSRQSNIDGLMMLGTVGRGGAGSTIQANRAAGNAFEQKVMREIQQTQTGVVQQITVKTESGVRTRIDLLGRDNKGNIVCTECKASSTAPLTKNQSIAFPEIQRSGATVVGKGKPGIPGGTQLPPTSINIVRP